MVEVQPKRERKAVSLKLLKEKYLHSPKKDGRDLNEKKNHILGGPGKTVAATREETEQGTEKVLQNRGASRSQEKIEVPGGGNTQDKIVP